MQTSFLYIFCLLAGQLLWAQNSHQNNEVRVVDVSVQDLCLKNNENDFCKTLNNNSEVLNKKESVSIETKDDDGDRWIFRFHFGFTRTNYHATDLNMNSTQLSGTASDVKFIERTSSHHYNPKNWHHIDQSLKWIDEPTNTFTFSFEKKNNNLYITVFHPKWLKSLKYKKVNVAGEEKIVFEDMNHTENFSTPLPEGYSEMYIGNTHYNMNWQLGYGRRLQLMKSRRFGQVSIVPRIDVGLSTGKARSVRIEPGVAWEDYVEDNSLQGFNGSVGVRLEYKLGKVSAYAEQKNTFSKISHGFYDGVVDYNLNYSTFSFGLGIDLFKSKKK